MAKSIFDNCILPEDFQRLSDTEKTILFLRALGYQDNDKIYLRRLDDQKRSDTVPQNMECPLYQFASLRESVRDLNERQHFGLFLIVNGGGQNDKDVIRAKKVRAHFMEIDDLPIEDQAARIFAFPLPPSIIVRTRKSLHTYWLIKDGDIKQFRDIQARLAVYFGGDRAISNESRTMRLPYSFHNKKAPFLVEIIHFAPENIYTQEDLKELLPEIGGEAGKPSSGKNERYELPDTIEEHYRNNALFLYACSLQSRGFSDQEIQTLVHDANRDRCVPALPGSEVDQILESALSRYKKGNALKRFHKYRENGKPFDIIDEEIRKYILQKEKIIVTDGQIRIYEGGVYRYDNGDRITMDKVKRLMFPEVIKISRIRQAVELIRNDISVQMVLDDVNQYPKHWINFKNGMLDVRTMELLPHDPKYYAVNQIPYDYDPGYKIPAGSVVGKFIEIKFPDPEDRRMFLQYCGYCMTTETNWQKFLILFGEGETGKSTLLRLLEQMIGRENISTLSLQKINERFMSADLRGKLLNACADIPSAKLETDDVIKQIVGEDVIHGEIKHGDIFSFRNYAKLIFSANNIPANYNDVNGAFNRRLALIEIGEIGEIIPDLENGLQKDIQSFIHLCVNALHETSGRGFCESANSIRHREELKKENDSVYSFLQDCTVRDPDRRVLRAELHRA